MTAKQTLIQALEKLKPHREMAEGFLAFVESEECGDESVENLILHIQKSMQHIKQHSIYMQKSHQMTVSIEQQEKDIQEAEALLESFIG